MINAPQRAYHSSVARFPWYHDDMGLIIISGVDRAGMDIAHELGIPLMGMVPLGWRTEDDENPESLREDYPELVESSYPYRTRRNVLSADGVMIITRDDVRKHRGTMLTCSIARNAHIPLGFVSLWDDASVDRARSWAHGVHGDFRLDDSSTTGEWR